MKFENSENFRNIQELLNKHYNNALKHYLRVAYYCSCSKKYESYSALYFHVREKHGVKLHAVISEDLVQVQIQDDRCYIIYNVEKIRSKQQNQKKQLFSNKERFLRSHENSHTLLEQPKAQEIGMYGNLDDAFSGFFQSMKIRKTHNFSNAKAVLQLFRKFILKQIKILFPQTKNKQSITILKSIECANLPTYFNKFVCQYFPERTEDKQDVKMAIDVLFKFANWMKQKQFTSTSVEINDEFMN